MTHAAPTPIERVPPLERREFRERYELAERPVVIAGGARQLPAFGSWSPGSLAEKVGHVEIAFKLSSCHAHPDFNARELAAMFARGSGRFDEFLRSITSGDRRERARRLFTGDERFLLQRRQGKTARDAELGALLDDAPLPELVDPEQLYTVWAWFSGPGVRTWLHYDNNGCHNLNAQITGEKVCWLYPPSELGKLAPFPLGGANPAHNCSQIDVDAPDLARFPEFASAAVFSAELCAGDLLFIPAFWFHTFRHRGEFNSNVNFWYKPERLRSNPIAARQALLEIVAAAGVATRQSPERAELFQALDAAAIQAGERRS